jgi:ribonuclease Z
VQTWIAGRRTPLEVYGPPGVDAVVLGFSAAYGLDARYRVAHHGTEAMPPDGALLVAKPLELPAPDESAVVLEGEVLVGTDGMHFEFAPNAESVRIEKHL